VAGKEVIADPFAVCPNCPAMGTLTPEEHNRKCYGRLVEKVGAAACGKKQQSTRAIELYPEIFKQDI